MSSASGDDPLAEADDFADPFAGPEELSDPFATTPLPVTRTPVGPAAPWRGKTSRPARLPRARGDTRPPPREASAAAADAQGRRTYGRSSRRTHGETTYVPATLVVVGGLLAAVAIYLAFVEIRPLSVDPLGNALVFLAMSTAALVLVTVAVAVAIRGAVVSRPRHRPLLAIVLGVVLVPLLVFGAVSLGLNEAKASFQHAAASDLGQVFTLVLDLLQDQGVELGPLDTLTD